MELLLWCIHDWRSSVRFTVGPQTGIMVFCKSIALIHKSGGFSCFWVLLDASVECVCQWLKGLHIFTVSGLNYYNIIHDKAIQKLQMEEISAAHLLCNTDQWHCLCFSQGPNPRAPQYPLSSTNTYPTTSGFCQSVQLKKSLTLDQPNPWTWALMSTSEKMKETKDHIGLYLKKGRMVLQGELGVLALAFHALTIEHCRNYLATAMKRGDNYSALKRSGKVFDRKRRKYTHWVILFIFL